MFEVVLHIPVVKSRNPRTRECSGVDPKVWNVRVEPEVLGATTQESEPTAIKRSEGKHDDEKPVPTEQKYKAQAAMSKKEGSSPNFVTLSKF